MKLWKSPVFHFGILLVVAVVGLLLAPFVIDWNSYRSDLEAYGRKLTGRTVTISGPVSARLFPWPRLSAEAISIANPAGLSGPDFATVERITIRMTLAGLLQGNLDVESIDVEDPAIHLERLATGGGNWLFTPDASVVASDVLSRVRLDKITFKRGSVSFSDVRRGETIRLTGVNAEAASPGLEGPWRLRGLAQLNGHPLDVAVNTGRHEPGQPFMFGIKLSSADHSGYVLSFDGAFGGQGVAGTVRLEPAAAEDGKTDAEGRIRPLVFTAQAEGNFDRVKLTQIELARLDGGTSDPVASGTAELSLGQRIAATIDLEAAMLDLDELAGAKSRSLLREAGSLALANSLLAQLPDQMTVTGDFRVTALKAEGQTFDSVNLALEADRERLRITRFAAGLPGRSSMLFTGAYFPGLGGGELNGDLALETDDLRGLTLWLWPEGRARLEGSWTGSRGRFKMQTGLGMTASDLRLSPAAFELDGQGGTASLTLNAAGRGAVDLTLESGRFDFDAYAPQGIPALPAVASQGVGALLALALPRDTAPDLRLKVKAGEVLLNRVTASDVALDLQSSASGLDLRALRIGAVGGAVVEAAGLILDTGNGPDGAVSLDVTANDPRELIRLAGLAPADALPVWAQQLGPTRLRADLGVSAGDGGPEMVVKLDGKAGDISLTGQGRSTSGNGLSGAVRLDAPRSAPILALFGVETAAGDMFPGSLSLQVSGSAEQGFTGTAALQGLGASLDYEGQLNPQMPGFGLDGKLRLRSTDSAPLVAAAGLPASPGAGSALVVEAPVSWSGGKWQLTDLSGRLGLEEFTGAFNVTPDGVLDGRFASGPLTLRDVLAVSFLEWSGSAVSLETGFAGQLPFGLTGQVWLTPATLTLYPGREIRTPEIGLEALAGSMHLVIRGKDSDGGDVAVEVRSEGEGASRNLSGALSLPLDLPGLLSLSSGTPVAQGRGQIDLRFTSEGRSPAAALASARGEGSYRFEDFRLTDVTPAAFAQALVSAKDAAGVTQAFTALRGGAGIGFGAISGTVGIANGEMNFAPIELRDEAADVSVRTIADLASGGIDMEATLRFKTRPGLPPMSVAFAGPPGELVRSEDNSALATALGVTLMQEGLVELERLQEEQARLAKQEEEQRKVDEARLQAYYAQRDELLLRKRELRVHGELQAEAADRLRRQIEAERAANAEINKAELRQRLRELKTWRRIAQNAAEPPPARKTAPPKPPPRPSKPGPVILEKPPGAPVVISPAPGSAPSQ